MISDAAFETMIRKLGPIAVAFAMFAVVGGHWAALQVVAWSQMLVDYSQEATLLDAAKMTFSGEAPCSMCVTIEESRQQERETNSALAQSDKKIENFLTLRVSKLLPPDGRQFSYPTEADPMLPSHAFSPPKPVPRAGCLA